MNDKICTRRIGGVEYRIYGSKPILDKEGEECILLREVWIRVLPGRLRALFGKKPDIFRLVGFGSTWRHRDTGKRASLWIEDWVLGYEFMRINDGG